MSGCETIFEGSKLFPKIRKTLNVLIIEHTIFDVIEVIVTNEPCPDPAESRIYIDTEVLDLKVGLINKDGERKNFDASCNYKITQKKVKYIVDRLQATSYSEEKKIIEFCMQFTFADRDEDFESGVDADSMVIERPDALFPYKRHNVQYLLSDKCPTEASFTSGPSVGVTGHRDSLAVTRHYQKPLHPRSMLPAAAFSGPGNAAIKRAHSDLGAATQQQQRTLSGLLPRILFGKGVTINHISSAELPSPNKTSSTTSSGSDSPMRDGSSKKEGTLISLSSILWTSVSAIGNSLKLNRSQKVVPGSEHSCKDDHSGFERASGKTDESYITSPNHSPLPSQRVNVCAVGLAPQ